MHFAAQKGHLHILKALRGWEVDFNAHDHNGFLATHFAAQNDHCDVLTYVLKVDADFGAVTNSGATPGVAAADPTATAQRSVPMPHSTLAARSTLNTRFKLNNAGIAVLGSFSSVNMS